MALDKQLQFWLALPTIVVLTLLGSVPFLFPVLALYEGRIMPVVRNVEIVSEYPDEIGMFLQVRFDKVRSCDFIGISWYDEFNQRVVINFAPEEANMPESRPVMDGQVTGPWHLIGLTSIEGSVAVVSHRCHPFWTTFTRFYPEGE